MVDQVREGFDSCAAFALPNATTMKNAAAAGSSNRLFMVERIDWCTSELCQR